MKTKKLLLLALMAFFSIGVWGTDATATWGGYGNVPAKDTPSTKNGITFLSNFAPNAYGYYELVNAANTIDISTNNATDPLLLTSVSIAVTYTTESNTLLIQFSSSSTFNQSALVGTATTLTGSANNITCPDLAKSARIYRLSDRTSAYNNAKVNTITVNADKQQGGTEYTASFAKGPEAVTGTVPADIKKAENATYSLPSASTLSYTGYKFAGWNDGSNTYPAGQEMTMTADVTYTAQWEVVVVPTITDLAIASSEDNVVNLTWNIPGIVDISNPVAPAVKTTSTATYTYESGVAKATGTTGPSKQIGMAFAIPSVSNIESVSYDYSGMYNATVKVWAGFCDATNAYWQKDHTVSPASGNVWNSDTSTPNQIKDGATVANPLASAMTQVAFYAYVGYGYDVNNYNFSVRNVRYHVKDAIDIDEVVVMLKAGSASTSLSDGTEIYRGTDFKFTDNSSKSAGDYYYTVFALDADDNVSAAVSIKFTYVSQVPHTVTYAAGAEDVTGDLPTEPDHVQGAKFTLAAATGFARKGYTFTGWNDGSSSYAAGAEYTMPNENVTLTAQWSALVVPAVTDLVTVEPANNIVPLQWNIPGIVDLSNAVTPNAQASGTTTYSYDAAKNEASVTGSCAAGKQFGMAFAIPSVENIESISYEHYLNYNYNVKMWPGLCDAENAYWQNNHQISSAYSVAWTADTYTPDYIKGGTSVTNPLASAMSQVAFYGSSAYAISDYSFSVRNVRYHVQGAVEIDKVIVLMKTGSAATSIDDEEATTIYEGTASTYTDLTEKVGGTTYYYTVFAMHKDGTLSAAVSTSYTYVEKTPHTVTYVAGAEDVTGTLPTETDRKEGEKFAVAALGDLARGGYVFKGWSDGANTYQPGVQYTMPDEAVEFTAQWKAYTALPATLDPDDAVLSGAEWSKGDGCINHSNMYVNSGSVTWMTTATQVGAYDISVNFPSEFPYASLNFIVTVYNSDSEQVGQVSTTTKTTGVQNLGAVSIPAAGTYRVVVTNTTYSIAFTFKDLKFEYNVQTISDQAEDNTLLVSLEEQVINAQLEREFKGGMYNTVCLPFDLDADQIDNSDLAGAKIIQLVSTSVENDKLYLNFEQVDAMEAGKGYLIAPLSDVADPTFAGVTVTETVAAEETVGKVKIIPSFIVSAIPYDKNNLFLYLENTLYYPNAADYRIDGLRFYYQVTEGNQVPAHIRMLTDTPTQLNQVESIVTVDGKYIQGGQLYIRKSGIIYNAQGQIVK